MSLRCRRRNRRGTVALSLAALALAATARAQQGNDLPTMESGPLSVAVTTLFPGGGSPPPENPLVKVYQGNPQYISEGRRLFSWYNCSGCHANGGGGMGPALMNDQWRYGGRLDQIYASIAQGRPNGMPSWAGKLPDAQMWEIAAFIRSLSAAAPPNKGQTAPTPPPIGGPPPPKSEATGVQTTPK
jgi:cytochrome c oxidase cbb3-type subunit 3